MKHSIIPIVGLILLNIHILQCQLVIGSGSEPLSASVSDDEVEGSGAILAGSDDTEEGSGRLIGVYNTTTSARPKTNVIIIKDDEDEANEIAKYSGGGPLDSNQDIEIGSGALTTESTDSRDLSTDHIECRQYYCWCLDSRGTEVPGSLVHFSRGFSAEMREKIVSIMKCGEKQPDVMVPSSVATTTQRAIVRVSNLPVPEPDIVIEETMRPVPTTMPHVIIPLQTRPRVKPRPSTKAPYIVGNVDQTPKYDKPAVPEEPEQVDPDAPLPGHGGQVGNSIRTDPVPPESALLTHPGILAAIIGGGVVALLSGLLLVMFIVYRMKKKDEGSYPLDADSKPPRLHTYTRAPNKEFYA